MAKKIPRQHLGMFSGRPHLGGQTPSVVWRNLTDDTGNRRWLPFEVESIQNPFYTTLPYELMYAEAWYLIQISPPANLPSPRQCS